MDTNEMPQWAKELQDSYSRIAEAAEELKNQPDKPEPETHKLPDNEVSPLMKAYLSKDKPDTSINDAISSFVHKRDTKAEKLTDAPEGEVSPLMKQYLQTSKTQKP